MRTPSPCLLQGLLSARMPREDTRAMDRRPAALDPQSHTWMELGEVQRLLLDSHPGIVLELELDGRIRRLNPAGAQRLGYGREELVGRDLVGSLVSLEEVSVRAAQLSRELGEHVAADAGVLVARLQRGMPFDEHDWVLRHKDGSPQPARLAIGSLRNSLGEPVGLMAVESAHADDELRPLLTHHDTLTGLPSREVLADRAEMALQRAARQQSVVAMMLVDIEGFDAICEEHGHSVGDDLLRATASRLHFELRKTDTAVRIDRGQFAAMLVDLHNAEEAQAVAGKIQRALSARVNVGVAMLPVNTRIGLAWYPGHADQLLPLLQAAEAALAQPGAASTGVVCAPLPPA